jgi:type VI secretion system VasD/TssJ family lipoprotein
MPQLKHTIMTHRCRHLSILGALFALTGCVFGGSSDAPRMCLDIEASANLNQFEGQPHVVVLYFYPLQSQTAFLAASPRSLVSGDKPGGITGDRWEATVLPGQRVELEEQLPRDTVYVGVVADFYRTPSRAVLSPSCGIFGGEKVVLSATDLQVAN